MEGYQKQAGERGMKKLVALSMAVIMTAISVMPVYAANVTQYYDVRTKLGNLGKYQYTVEAHEIPSNEVLPIIDKSYFPVSVAQYETEVDNTAPLAEYEVSTVQKVDVVFAFGQLSQSKELEQLIDRLDLKINAAGNKIDGLVQRVETQEMNMQNSFKWETDVNTSIGNITFADGGATVNMVGNSRRPGKNAMWILQDQVSGRQTIEFDYSLSYGDSFSAAGVLCNIGRVGNKIEGYAIVCRNRRSSLGDSGGAGIYWLSYDIGGNTSQFSTSQFKKLADLGVTTSGTLKVDMSNSDITVSGGGMATPVKVTLDKHYGFGLGFFSEHYSHHCSHIGSFNIKNIKLTKTDIKTLGDAISDVAWRDNSLRFVIHATDVIPSEMKDTTSDEYLYTVAKLLGCDAYLVNLGRDVNKDVLEKLVDTISSNITTKGIYYDNRGIQGAVDKAAQYIIDVAKQFNKPTKWILVNTEVTWNTLFNDLEKDPPLNFGEHNGTKNDDISDITLSQNWGKAFSNFKDDKLVAEKWRYRHFNNFYDNSIVQESFHNIWMSDPVTIFPYPGKYRINYKRKDNPFHPDVNILNPFDEYRKWSTNYDPYVPGQN